MAGAVKGEKGVTSAAKNALGAKLRTKNFAPLQNSFNLQVYVKLFVDM